MPELMSNDSYEQWTVDGELDAEARAVEKVKELLDRYEEPALPDDVDEELRDYVAPTTYRATGDDRVSGRLDGKVALVTGATSGIGRASAELLAREGASVMVSGRSVDDASITVAAIVAGGGSADVELGDISDSKVATSIVAATSERFGSVDVLVNAAGVIVRHDAVDTSDDDWRRVMATNVDALFYVSRAAVVAMRRSGGGSIVNIASNVGLVGTERLAAYCASKGAVIALTRAMALDHAAEGFG